MTESELENYFASEFSSETDGVVGFYLCNEDLCNHGSKITSISLITTLSLFLFTLLFK